MNFITKSLGIAFMAFAIGQAHAAGELKGNTLNVAVDPTNPPFSTLDNDYRTPIGLDIDIIMELKKRLGFEIAENRILPMLRGEQLRRVKDAQVDLIAGSLSATTERAAYMDFTPVYFDTGLTLIYSKSKYSNVKDLNKFKNAKVGSVEGSVGLTFIDQTLPSAQKVSFPSFMVGIVAVTQGKVDAMVYDRPIIEYFAQSMPEFNLEIVDGTFERQFCQIALGLTKNSPYTYLISRELQNMKNDGTLDALIDKYLK